MTISDDKLIQMAEDIRETLSMTRTHKESIKKIEDKIDSLDEKVDTLTTDVGNIRTQWMMEREERESLARTSDVTALKTKVESVETTLDEHCKSGLAGNLSVKDWKQIIKILALIVGMLVVGSAGGQGLSTLVKMLLDALVVFGQ